MHPTRNECVGRFAQIPMGGGQELGLGFWQKPSTQLLHVLKLRGDLQYLNGSMYCLHVVALNIKEKPTIKGQ